MVYRRDFRRIKKPVKLKSVLSLTISIIIVNVVLFFVFLLISQIFKSPLIITSACNNEQFNSSIFQELVAVQSCNIFSGHNIWTILTSMFMHGSLFHLFVNMLSLFFLGGLVERIIGRKRFLWLYLIAGIVGSLFFVIFAYLGMFIPMGEFIFGDVNAYAVGASGAIFGLLGILATLLPRKKVYLIVGPLIVIVLQVLISNPIVDLIASVLIFLMIFAMFSPNEPFRKIAVPLALPFWLAPIIAIVPLMVISYILGLRNQTLPIGNMAHFGGLVVGLLYGAYLRSKYKQKVKLLNKVIR